MRILICGDRNWTDEAKIRKAVLEIHSETTIELVIEGGARGADALGKIVGRSLGIEVISFPADWVKFGRPAGPIRNRQMLQEGKPDLVLAFHNNIMESKGTKDMIKASEKAGIPVRLIP